MSGGEPNPHLCSAGEAHQVGAFDSGCVHYRGDVQDAVVQGRQFDLAVGQARSPMVEHQYAKVRSQAFEHASETGTVPESLDVSADLRNEDQWRPLAVVVIGHPNVVGRDRVVELRSAHAARIRAASRRRSKAWPTVQLYIPGMTNNFLPAEFDPPTSFDGPGFHLEPLAPVHNERDHEAWMSSVEHIKSTPGKWTSWPTPMTLEQNMGDMEMHYGEFVNREAFTYSVLDGDDVIGCLYIYPDENSEADAYVSSWVRESRAEMDVVVWRAVSEWLESAWPFGSFRYAARNAS